LFAISRLALLLAVMVCAAPRAQAEVILLATPKCVLDKEADLSAVECKALGATGLRVVAGRKASEAKPAAGDYVIEMLTTHVHSENFTERLTLDGMPGMPVPVTYPRIRLLQPYKLWYCPAAAAPPQPLGEGFGFYMSTPVEHLTSERVRITDKKPAELTQEGMLKLCEVLGRDIENAVAQKIVLGSAYRLNPVQIPRRYNTPAESEVYRLGDRPRFGAAKVTYQADGTASVEVPLHNRLPVRVAGKLRREETSDEFLARARIGGAVALNRPECEEKFDLAPGEKQLIKFTVLAPLVVRGLPEKSAFEVRMMVVDPK
jgi:hypothetical protein